MPAGYHVKLVKLAQKILIGAIILLFVGFGIGMSESVPLYAVVLVDDATKTYFAPQCMSPRAKNFAQLRRATLADAHELKYKLDDECRNSGAFSTEGTSATGCLLIKLGILSPPHHWWDMPSRTEDGVIHPAQKKC